MNLSSIKKTLTTVRRVEVLLFRKREGYGLYYYDTMFEYLRYFRAQCAVRILQPG